MPVVAGRHHGRRTAWWRSYERRNNNSGGNGKTRDIFSRRAMAGGEMMPAARCASAQAPRFCIALHKDDKTRIAPSRLGIYRAGASSKSIRTGASGRIWTINSGAVGVERADMGRDNGVRCLIAYRVAGACAPHCCSPPARAGVDRNVARVIS